MLQYNSVNSAMSPSASCQLYTKIPHKEGNNVTGQILVSDYNSMFSNNSKQKEAKIKKFGLQIKWSGNFATLTYNDHSTPNIGKPDGT